MNFNFYPQLLKYQSSSMMAQYILDESLTIEDLRKVDIPGKADYDRHALDFYLGKIIPYDSEETVKAEGPSIGSMYYLNPFGLELFDELEVDYQVLSSFEHFHVTTLNGTFLNPKTRDKELSHRYLVRVGNN